MENIASDICLLLTWNAEGRQLVFLNTLSHTWTVSWNNKFQYQGLKHKSYETIITFDTTYLPATRFLKTYFQDSFLRYSCIFFKWFFNIYIINELL